MPVRLPLILLLILLQPLLWVSLHAEEIQPSHQQIRFNCFADNDSRLSQTLNTLYKEAFAQLGYDFIMLRRPIERSLRELNQGNADGICIRIAGLTAIPEHKDLMQLSTAIVTGSFYFWSYQDQLDTSLLSDINNSPIKVGYVEGTLAVENYLKQNPITKLTGFYSYPLALKNLQAGRIDLLIAAPLFISAAMDANPQFRQPHKYSSLFSVNAYPYLHQRHGALKQPLEKILTKLLSNPDHPVHQLSP